MGDFDKIIKENIEAVFLPLAEKLLGIKFRNSVDLPEKLHSTIEREPDFLKKVTSEESTEIILHIEFQTGNEPKMVYRMAEYKALLQRKFELPVRQFVIYIGMGQATMRTELRPEEIITGFQLKSINQLPVDETLASNIPEEIILSILADYPRADAPRIVSSIIKKLQDVSTDATALKRHIQQLLTLSRLRKLDEETEKQLETMPITYDIKQDYLYNKAKRSVIEKMLDDASLSIEKIAHFTDTTVAFVKQVQEELRTK